MQFHYQNLSSGRFYPCCGHDITLNQENKFCCKGYHISDKFLELDYYPHYFDNIKNNHREVEKQWGMKDMHEVRSTIKRVSKRPEEVLSDYVLNKYSNLEYWKVSSGKYY